MGYPAVSREIADLTLPSELYWRRFPKKLHMKSFTHSSKRYWVNRQWCTCLAKRFNPCKICKHQKHYLKLKDAFDDEQAAAIHDHRESVLRECIEKCISDRGSTS